MTVAYDGKEYCGWQVQPNGTSIQSMLERAIAQVCRERIRVTGSGRTDSGVHAIGQVASFSLGNWRASANDLHRALNSKLPSDIAIKEILDAPEDFHAIRDATGKRYRYQLQIGGVRDAFAYRYHWHVQGPVDIDRMREATSYLIGVHDFASFQATGANRKTTVRDVRDLVIVESPKNASDHDDAVCVAIEIEANGFLYNMVRNIVGSLMEIGRGKQSPDWMQAVLLATDRKQAGPTAPPHGLFLLRVDYGSA
jgi:tRNA pseudouridine38-40 synthase